MEILDIVIAGVIICLAGMVQSAVGFGYALFATPLLVLLGMPLLSVITIVATCSMMQATIGVWKLRNSVPWHLSLPAVVIRVTGLLIGLFILSVITWFIARNITQPIKATTELLKKLGSGRPY